MTVEMVEMILWYLGWLGVIIMVPIFVHNVYEGARDSVVAHMQEADEPNAAAGGIVDGVIIALLLGAMLLPQTRTPLMGPLAVLGGAWGYVLTRGLVKWVIRFYYPQVSFRPFGKIKITRLGQKREFPTSLHRIADLI